MVWFREVDVVLWHGDRSLFMQEAFLRMSTETNLAKYVVGDFAIGLVLAASTLGLVCWKKHKE